MGKTVSLILAVALMFSVALVGCGPEEAPPPAAPPPAAPPPAAPPPAAPPPAAPPPPPPPVEKTPWEKLVEAAKDEGTVNVYIVLGAPTENAIKEGFKAKYGIAVETVTGRPPTVHAKLVEEQIAGVYIADMYLCGSSTLDDFWAAGYSQAPLITPPSMEDRGVFMTDPYDMDPEGKHFWILESPNASVLINTNLVKEGEITSYQDLMDPKWTGQIVMTDPRVPGPGNSAMFAGMRVNSLDWWKEFANKQQPLLERNHQRPIDAVVLGEKSLALYISNSRAFGAMEAGGPVKLIHLKEGSHVPRMGGAIPKNAPHPNAATLLVDWILSKEGQTAICKARGEPSFRKDVTADWVIPDMTWDAPFKLLPAPMTVADNDESKAFAVSAFGAP